MNNLDSLNDGIAEPELQPSRAVVANHDRRVGIVLWYTDHSRISMEIDAISGRLDDLGLDDAPNGISIWEGDYVWRPGGYECPQDGYSDPVGKFRSPTDAEWQAIREGRSPW